MLIEIGDVLEIYKERMEMVVIMLKLQVPMMDLYGLLAYPEVD